MLNRKERYLFIIPTIIFLAGAYLLYKTYSLSTLENSLRQNSLETLREISSRESEIQKLNKELKLIKQQISNINKSISRYPIPHSGYEIQSSLNKFSFKYNYQFSIISLEKIGNFYRLKAVFSTKYERKFLKFLKVFTDTYPQTVYSIELEKPKDKLIAKLDTKIFFWKEK